MLTRQVATDAAVADVSTPPGAASHYLRGAGFPAFLLNPPFSLATDIVNNRLMEDLSEEERVLDRDKAVRQFLTLYRYLSERALVYLLPSVPGLQDQTYVANLGVVLAGGDGGDAVVSRFRVPNRAAEAVPGRSFLELLGFRTHLPPSLDPASPGEPLYFEGEADLKPIGRAHVGGWGIRTSRAALAWLERTFELEVIPLHLTDPRLYHLDTCLLPLPGNRAAACTAVIDRATLRRIERHVEILDVTLGQAHYGICNSLVLGSDIVTSSDLDTLPASHPQYAQERDKNERLEAIAATAGLEPVYLDLMEFEKSGAGLSCLVMHLNRVEAKSRADRSPDTAGPANREGKR